MLKHIEYILVLLASLLKNCNFYIVLNVYVPYVKKNTPTAWGEIK